MVSSFFSLEQAYSNFTKIEERDLEVESCFPEFGKGLEKGFNRADETPIDIL